jgi:hypothetical protein
MKHNIVYLIIFLFFLMLLPRSVLAHTLKIDGTIGVNLHVDPDDAPVAGSESKFLLDIQDKSGRFNPNNPANCDCTLTVKQKGVVIKTLPVVSGGSYAQLRFTFPTSDVYEIVVEGKPKGEGVPFQAFQTTFEYFVKSSGSEPAMVSSPQNALSIYAPWIALVIGVCIIAMFVL